ncbi:MAG: cysteine synthase [Desulfocurvibacter africanus]
MPIHTNVLSLVGNTPLVEIGRLNPYPDVRILAKIESKSIGGSIKDRVALAMIEAAERSGELTPDKTVIEATSGNTGIGLAMVCAVKGYRIKLLMSESASEERKRILRAYGAEIVLTPGHMGTDGAIEEAYRLAREEPGKYVLMDQYNNEACVRAHHEGTAREIWEQTGGQVTHMVATLGTTGTAMGLASGLKAFNPAIFVAAVEPFAGHKIQGLKNMQESYPPGIYDKKALDAVLNVEDDAAFDMARRMAREEGLLVGMSAGAAMAGALRLAKDLTGSGRHSTIVFICPDSGERYLSTPLFAAPTQQGLRVRDLASGQARVLEPGKAGLGLFTPGPSLDQAGDLEVWRRVVLLDVLCRHLRANGVQAKACVGLADLDDRALAAARAAGMPRREFARRTREEIQGLAAMLGVSEDVHFTLAGESTERALTLCRRLLARGLAYEKLRSVYYDVLRDKAYGQTGSMDLERLSLGKTVDLRDYVKDNPRDFTLLKRVTLQDLKAGDALETEWGKVRPSWFLQQAAAALDGLPALSVALGAETHRFPHLENFRAIWTLGAGVVPTAWLVAQPVIGVLDSAVANSPGVQQPVFGLREAVGAVSSGAALRMWLLSTSYHKPLSLQSLPMWSRNWRKTQELYVTLSSAERKKGEPGQAVAQAAYDLRQGLFSAVEDDLSLHRFWPELFKFVRTINAKLAVGQLSGADTELCLRRLTACDQVLGILDHSQAPVSPSMLTAELAELVRLREEARGRKDFPQADDLRGRLWEKGYRLEDTPSGPRLYVRS